MDDVAARPSTNPDDSLSNDEWSRKHPEQHARLAWIADQNASRSALRITNKAMSLLEAAVTGPDAYAQTDWPIPGPTLAQRALYGHDQGDRKRCLRLLSAPCMPLILIPRRGYMLRSAAERMPKERCWKNLTPRKLRLLLVMSGETVVKAMRSEGAPHPLINGGRLRKRGSLSGPQIAKLAGCDYDSDVAKDLHDLVDSGILCRHNRGFRPDQWPRDAEVPPHPALRPPALQAGSRKELIRARLLRELARSSFRATRRGPRFAP